MIQSTLLRLPRPGDKVRLRQRTWLVENTVIAPGHEANPIVQLACFDDDVGLGKTIEADPIASELLLRRRIKGIVVAAPPNMLVKWQEEMDSRFGLRFEILDRLYLEKTRQERGYAVNPWTTFPRFLVSHKLLIDETYMAPLRDYLGAVRTNSSSSMPGGWRGRGGGGGLNISDTISRGRAQARELIFSCGFSRSRGRLLP